MANEVNLMDFNYKDTEKTLFSFNQELRNHNWPELVEHFEDYPFVIFSFYKINNFQDSYSIHHFRTIFSLNRVLKLIGDYHGYMICSYIIDKHKNTIISFWYSDINEEPQMPFFL